MRTNDFAHIGDSAPLVRLFADDLPPGEVHPAPAAPAMSEPVHAAGEQVLSIEDLAHRFNVSTKTISRWRDHGLVAQRFTVDGRRRAHADALRRLEVAL